MPEGWRRIAEPDLAVSFAVPDGWSRRVKNSIQSTWRSPDGRHDLSVKRDNAYGPTPAQAAEGQLAWYRDAAQSSMADLDVSAHPARHRGEKALWLEIDYHYEGQSAPRKRLELFVAGQAGYVYQLLVDTEATPERLARQRQLFTTARGELLPGAA
ncbi:hypothetical protein [Streptomyces capparidis]